MIVRLAKRVVLATLLVSVLGVGTAAAADVDGLYRASVPVDDRSPGELARGTRAALSGVLVKLTGDRQAAARSSAAEVLGEASSLLYKYGYADAPGVDGDELTLSAEFDPSALRGALERHGISTWGKERPETLIWLLVDEPGQRRIASNDEPGRWGEAVLERAESRGIPVLLPLVDIEAAQVVSGAAGWSDLAEGSLRLSARYGPPAVLVGYLREAVPGIWEADWRLRVGQEDYQWRHEGGMPDLLVDDGINALADALARRFADPAMLARADDLDLAIVGLATAHDYATVVNYLEELDTVAELFVRGVDAQRLAVVVRARGGRTAFDQSVAFGRVLAPVRGQVGVYALLR